MDWKRAKLILIFVFIALNVVLGVILYRNIKGGEVSQETIRNTHRILEQNNIIVECLIPTYAGKDYILQYQETILDKNTIISGLLGEDYTKIDENTYVKDTQRLVFPSNCSFEYRDSGKNNKVFTESKNEVGAKLKELSKKLGIPIDEFQLDSFNTLVTGEGSRAVYKGVYQGYSVFDNYIEVDVEKSRLKGIKYQYKKPVDITSRDINVIPVYQILISKISNYPGIKISDIDMGFKGFNVDKDTKTLYEGLSWRIKTFSGTEYFFNATNGESME